MVSSTDVITHYPQFNVLKFVDEWDSHTKEIVRKRLGPFPDNRYFSAWEAEVLATVISNMVYDNRAEIINWIVYHLDRKMSSEIGESHRKTNVPPEKLLFREGLKAIGDISQRKFGKSFTKLDSEKQFQIMAGLQKGDLPEIPAWQRIPQKELFNKIVSDVVSAYYSHPVVWSEIGYGGPAYPRGYVRIEYGLTDPWEAKRDGK